MRVQPPARRVVITFAFSFALLVLLQCELNEDGNPDWHDPWRALFIVLNMGLYTYTDETAQVRTQGLQPWTSAVL